MPPQNIKGRVKRSYRVTDARAKQLGLHEAAGSGRTADAFTNAAARMGWGTPSLAEGADYQLQRFSYNYVLLLTLYREHWISRRIVDGVAGDMVRAWPKTTSEIEPDDMTRLDRALRVTRTKSQILKTLKWARLFGGAGALLIIDGHQDQLEEPLDYDTVNPGAFKGLAPFDRWTGVAPEGAVCPDINRPLEFDLPEFYRVSVKGGTSFRVHASRILRFTGPEVPTPEYEAQAWWGISVLEPAYEEIRKRDNMSWNILSLTFRASLLGFKWGDMAQALSGAGMNSQALVQFEQRMEAFNRLLSNQSLAILPADGGLESVNYTFSGLSDVYQQFQLDIAGAAGYPVSRLFGRTITGLGQSNDADERLYEERVAMEQEEIRPQLEKLYSVLCMSELGEIPDDLNLAFPSIRVLNDSEKADIAGKNAATIVSLVNAGILNKPQAIKEVKQGSDVTGLGTNLTDEDIEAAERDEDLGLEPQMEGETGKDEPVAAKATDEWAESKHPRERSGENAGQFTSGGGSGGGSVSLESAPSDRGEWPDHIKKLKLPPAWKDVKINANPDADLLAIGKDKAGRPQYVYSKRFQNSQSESKFARIKELDGKFEKIWDQNQERLRSGDAKQRDHAECSRLIMAMGIRPGSDSDTKAKVKAYGATTLEGRHIVKEDGQVCLRFTGKKGVAINLPVADPEIAKSLLDRAKKAGADGKLFPAVSESSLLDYTHSFDGGGFKTKDFRTLLATRSAAKEVEKSDPPKDEREYKKRVMDVAKSVSGRLGNTPIVALQSYINPAIFAPWRSALATA